MNNQDPIAKATEGAGAAAKPTAEEWLPQDTNDRGQNNSELEPPSDYLVDPSWLETLRYNRAMGLPDGTSREESLRAFSALSEEEKARIHGMVGRDELRLPQSTGEKEYDEALGRRLVASHIEEGTFPKDPQGTFQRRS